MILCDAILSSFHLIWSNQNSEMHVEHTEAYYQNCHYFRHYLISKISQELHFRALD